MARVDENNITAAKLAEAYGILTRPTEDGTRYPAPTQAWYGADKHVMSVLYEKKTRAEILALAEDLRKTPHEILDRILLDNRSSLEMALAPRAFGEFLQRICPNDREAQWELLKTLSGYRDSVVGGVATGRHKDKTFALLQEAADGQEVLPMLERLLSCPRRFQADAIMSQAVELREILTSVAGDKKEMFLTFTDKNIADTAEINALARDVKKTIRLINGIGGDGNTVLRDLFASDATYAPDADAAKMRAVIENVDGVLALVDAVGGDRLYTLQELIESSPATGKIYETKDRKRTLLVAENAYEVAEMLKDGPYPPAAMFKSLMELSPQQIMAVIEQRDYTQCHASLERQLGATAGPDIRALIALAGEDRAIARNILRGDPGYAAPFNAERTAIVTQNAGALLQLLEQTGFPREFFPCLFEMSLPRLAQTAQKADMEFLRGIRAPHAREELKNLLAGTPDSRATPPRSPEDKPFILQIQQAKGGFGNTQPRYEIALVERPGLVTEFSDEDRHRLLNEVEKLVYQALKLPVYPGKQEGAYSYPREGEAVTDSRMAAPLLKRIGGAEETLKVHVNPATTALLQELLVATNRTPEIPAAARER